MKRRDFYDIVVAIVTGITLFIVAYNFVWPTFCKGVWPGGECKSYPEVTAAALGLGGAALAIVFQMRFEFVTSLREVWKMCLEGYVEVRMLYRLDQVSDADVRAAVRAMSVAIDSMRSVYSNVGESETHLGFYPYASLHDIRLIVQADHKSGVLKDAEKKAKRAEEVDSYWRSFRLHFLPEFKPTEPDRYIIKRRLADMRKPKVSAADRIRLRLLKTEDLLTEDDLRL